MLVERLGLQRLHPQALLGTGELVAVDIVTQRGELAGTCPYLLADSGQIGLGPQPPRLGLATFGVGGDQRVLQRRENMTGSVGHSRGNGRLALPHLPSPGRRQPRGPFARGGSDQRVRAAGQRSGPFLTGTHREPSLDLLAAHG